MQLANQTIIITGASSGIGLEMSRVLAAEGANIVMAARNLERLEQAAESLAGEGFAPLVVPTDVTQEADCRALAHAAQDAFGRLDILINNAGYAPPASLLDTTEALWDVTLDVCLKGAYLMTRAALPAMLAQGGGAILNVSSVAGKSGVANRTAYCAAKWGLHGFTEALRAELAGQNIRAYLLCPGPVATSWWQTVANPQPAEVLAKMLRPEEVAEAARWLLTRPDHLRLDEIVIQPRSNPWK